MSLAVLTGVACIIAGFFRLGFLADFLGKPVLVGFMNGIAISIVLGQIGKVFGFPIDSGRILPRLIEFVSKLPDTHLPTLAVGVTTFVVMRGVRRFFPRLPAPLIAAGRRRGAGRGLRPRSVGRRGAWRRARGLAAARLDPGPVRHCSGRS